MKTNSRAASCGIEPLESRIAPAAVFTFVEADHDTVKISTSKGTDADLGAAAHVNSGQLNVLDLSMATWGTEFAGASVSITVSKLGSDPGDGLTNVGEIDATGIDLGSVTVKGDLDKIVAGSAAGVVSVKSLTVNSLGALGITTGAPNLLSSFAGGLGPLKVGSDVTGAEIHVIDNLASMTIGGSLIGGLAANAGSIFANNVGAIKIGGDIRGGSAANTGAIFAGNMGSFSLGGSLIGGGGQSSGFLLIGNVGTMKIGGDLVGGTDSNTGGVNINSAAKILIGGSLFGEVSDNTGTIAGLTLGTIKIGGSMHGDSHGTIVSGSIVARTLGAVSVGGDVLGASIFASGNAAPVTAAQALAIKSLTVGGSFEGSQIIAGNFTNPDVQVGAVVVKGRWVRSDLVVGAKNLGTGDAAGGSGTAADNVNFGDDHDFRINAGGNPAIVAKIASITIGGEVRGSPSSVNSSDHFGFVAEQIGSFKIGGTVIPLTAGAGTRGIGDTNDVNIHQV